MSKAGRLSAETLSDKAVWRLVRHAAQDAGIEGWQRYSGHSLHAGLATAAGEAGATSPKSCARPATAPPKWR